MRYVNQTAGLTDLLPGRLVLERGAAADYRALAHFHYAAGAPATWAGVWAVRYFEERVGAKGQGCDETRDKDGALSFHSARTKRTQPATVAVAVLSYPVPSCRPRERWFGLTGTRAENLVFANANLRTISRVVVHPQFRSLGLSTLLVRCLCEHCDTRFVEAIAMMGRAHPLFDRAGMTRTNPDAPDDEPAYYVLDRLSVESIATTHTRRPTIDRHPERSAA